MNFYYKKKKTMPASRAIRLLLKSKLMPNGCWENELAHNGHGYVSVTVKMKKIYSHRLVYELFKGKIPVSLEIDHVCHNRRCINPDHLEAVTKQENLAKRGGKFLKKCA